MVYYLQKLQPTNYDGGPKRLSTIMSARTSHVDGPNIDNDTPPSSSSNTTTPSPPNDSQEPSNDNIVLLLSGYSYGSLILSRLPPIEEILTRFESAPHGTTPAEIILRSYRLAKESRFQLEGTRQNQRQQLQPEARGRRPTPSTAEVETPKPRLRASTAVVVGGEETNPHERRGSRETSRGASIVRRSVEVPLRIKARVRRRSSGILRPGSSTGAGTGTATREDAKRSEESVVAGAAAGAAGAGPSTPSVSSLPNVSVGYLLVSPVLPPLAHTLVPPVSWAGLRGGIEKNAGFGAMSCPTLIVWGSADSFTSNRRLRAWAERLSCKAGGGSGMLRWRDFEGEGHFWREAGVMKLMTGAIGEWVRQLPP